MLPKHQKLSAFTLVEVLVALVIFTISAVVLGASYLNVLNNYERVRQNQAFEEDLRFIRQLVLQEPDREELERGGTLDSLYLGRVEWRTYLEQTQTPDLLRVQLEITYEGSDLLAGRTQLQEFYLLRPSWADPMDRERLRAESAQRFLEARELREGR
jgi:general secretion pathway protein I